ncbi:MAG TPA: DUF2510 domain-containing protein [Streptosporangiaceae bacterium]|nr:DUF2510 domain-containing protein [Streptosporangiaceae bacterium]
MEMPPPGWYDDPVQTGSLLRWWDGTQWTGHSAPRVQALSAPTDLSDFPAADAADDKSLTEWFDSVPTRQEPGTAVALTQSAGEAHAARHGENSTRILDGALMPPAPEATTRLARGTGALARLGWRRSALVTEDSLPLVERAGYGGMLRRNKVRLIWAVALGTAVAMLITGVLVGVLGSSPTPKTGPAAAATRPAATHRASPTPSASDTPSTTATTGTPVSDAASGLSYALLAAPWQPGCPGTMNNAVFSWSAGENAVAGTVPAAGGSPWYASACSGLLPQQYAYTGVQDLPQTAMNLVNAFDPAYFSGLPHVRSTTENNPLQVSGHAGWIVEFGMTYQTAASQGLAWQSQLGAVVVVDRGTGQPPAVLYVTVPNNLGTANIGTILASMQLAAPAAGSQAATPPAAPTPSAPAPAGSGAPNP